MKLWWRLLQRLKLRTKYFVVTGISVLVLAVGSLITFRIVVDQYARIAYDGAAGILHLAAQIVERELTLAQELALRVATDAAVQRSLDALSSDLSAYDRSVAVLEIRSLAQQMALTYDFVGDVVITARDHTLIASRVPAPPIPPGVLERMRHTQSNELVYPEDGSGLLWIVLRARRVRDFSLEPIGAVTLSVNLNRIGRSFGTSFHATTSEGGGRRHLVLLHQGRVVWATAGAPQFVFADAVLPSHPGYEIVGVGADRFIAALLDSPGMDLQFVYLMPEGDVFGAAGWSGLVAVVAIGLFTAVSLGIGYWLSRKVTQPLEALSVQLEQMSGGDFEPVQFDPRDYHGDDEIAVFYRDFQAMVARIDRLMRENYLAKVQSAEARLRALQSQMSPHFLYNTLDTIGWLARSGDTQGASTIAEALGNLLRAILDEDSSEVPLRTEISHVQDYVTIQKYRFGDRLRFAVDIPESLLSERLPKLTLQPLVENSIKYAAEATRHGCTVVVSARRTDAGLQVTVSDDGPGFTQPPETTARGIGIANIRKRLEILYGVPYGLSISSEVGKGTTVTVLVPSRVAS